MKIEKVCINSFLKDKTKLDEVLDVINSIDWNTEHDKWYANHYQTTGAALIVKLFNEKLKEKNFN